MKTEVLKLISKTGNFLAKNSSHILTGFAATGVVSTAIFTYKGTKEAEKRTDVLVHEKKDGVMTKKEQFKATWDCYIPAIIMGATTIGCIFGAQYVNTKRLGVLATAYSMSAKALKELEASTAEEIGEKKLQKIKDNIAQKKVTENPPMQNVNIGMNQSLYMDDFSGRYFPCDYETFRKVQNDLTSEMLRNMNSFVSLNELYYALKLDPIGKGDDFGWYADDGSIEIPTSVAVADAPGYNNIPCVVINTSGSNLRYKYERRGY